MRFAYPMMLDVRDRPILVVGGGAVAVRKVRSLLDAGATRLTVVSPAFHENLPAAVVRVARRYDASQLDGVGLVFAATDDRAVNDAVVADCRTRGILISRADDSDVAPGDFSTPAQWRAGPVAVTVSAGSPALAATIRDGLAERWDLRWTAMAEAMRTLRPRIVGHPTLTPTQRAEVFRALATDEALTVAAAGGVDGLVAWLAERHAAAV